MKRTLLNECNGNAVITFTERPNIEFHISEKEIGRGATCVVYHAVGSDNTEHLLKEYYPKHLDLDRDSSGRILVPENKADAYNQGLLRFQNGCEQQKAIRLSNEGLKNFTCNIQGYYRANGTEYIDMTCFSGQTYDHVQEKTVYNLMLRMRTLAQVVGNYHKAGLLHLDIKPENIYVRPENETTQDVMLFDFDSVTPMTEIGTAMVLSCTKTWAAPEQLLPEKRKNICAATDLFAIGEIVFVQLFGRHSTNAERRSFATEYSYNHKADIFKNMNPKVFQLLDDLLSHTICGVAKKRYQSAEELIATLDDIIEMASPKKPYLRKMIPHVPQHFVGRTCEIDTAHKLLSKESVVFVSGIGGIGKSELVKQYAKKYADHYDTITLVAFDTDISTTIQNADNFPYNIKRYRDEGQEEFLARKIEELQKICTPQTLIIVDNFDVTRDPNIQVLFALNCKVLVTTRADFSDVYTQICIEALDNPFEVFQKHYQKPLTVAEHNYVEQIIGIVCGHTLTVELLAKQMMASRISPKTMLEKLQNGGIRESGKEKVYSGKDGVLLVQNTHAHIRALFDLSRLNDDELYILKNLSIVPRRGISAEVFYAWCELNSYDRINELTQAGWIYWDEENDFYSLHPLIADILQNQITISDFRTLISHFANELTDDDTGEVILSVVPFSFANSLAVAIIKYIQKKEPELETKLIHCVVKFGDFFFEQGLFDLSESCFCIAKTHYEKLGFTDAFLEVSIINSLALLYDKQAQLLVSENLSKKALAYLLDCLEIVKQPENNLTEYIGTMYGNIGSVYHSLKDYEKAEFYYTKALDLSGRCNFYTDIGVLYEEKGNYQYALKMHQEAMGKAIEHNEPALVVALIEHNMAVCFKRLGLLGDAATHCENALRIREKAFDAGNAYDLALSKSMLGQIYAELGTQSMLTDAKVLLVEAMRIMEDLVGADNIEYQKASATLKRIDAL